jgi:hypothetical protein
MQSLQSVTPLVVPPLLQLEGNRPLQAVYLSFESGVPCELPLPPKAVLQAYLILNTSRYRRPQVCTRSTLGSGHLEGPTDGTGQTPDTRVNACLIWSFRVERNDIVQACLEYSVRLKSGRYGGLRKDNRHVVSISMGK